MRRGPWRYPVGPFHTCFVFDHLTTASKTPRRAMFSGSSHEMAEMEPRAPSAASATRPSPPPKYANSYPWVFIARKMDASVQTYDTALAQVLYRRYMLTALIPCRMETIFHFSSGTSLGCRCCRVPHPSWIWICFLLMPLPSRHLTSRVMFADAGPR